MPHFSASVGHKTIAGIKIPIPDIDVDWYAKGTNFAPGGLAMVGERGPELIQLPRGSKVHTAQETKKMNGGTTYNFHNQFTSKPMTPSEINREEQKMLRRVALEGGF